MAYTVSASAAFERIVQLESLAGSSVLLPAFICPESFEPIFERYDIDPVFVDVDRETQHVDVDRAARHLGDVDAALLVHAFGLPADVDWWIERTRREDVLLVEDCARALGARRDGRPVGGFGDYAIFSFSKVSPLFTGGCLVSAAADERFDLAPPTISVDLLVKTLYYGFPWEVPYEKRLVSLYRRLIGDRGYSIEGTEIEETEVEKTEREFPAPIEEPSVRRLDPLNRRLLDRHLRRGFPRALERQRSIGADLRDVLESHDFGLQPDPSGRVHYALSATAPGNRDALVEFLRSRGNVVRVVWRDPWGPSRDAGSGRRYPETNYLANHVVTFPVAELSRADADRLIRDVRAFYADETSANPP